MAFFRSMGGRVFLILLIGVLSSTFLTWWLAFGERQRMIGQLRENRALEQAEQFILTLDAIPPAGRQAFMATARRFGLKGELADEKGAQADAMPSDSVFVRSLQERLGREFQLISLPAKPYECMPKRERRADAPPRVARGICDTISVRLRDGAYARVTVLPPRPPPPPTRDFPLYLGIFLGSIGILAYIVSRMTMRPLHRLAQAAEDLGRNIDHPPLPEDGATELRRAAAAFNAMQARIRDHIRQRTQMLAAITHDLQTPLTRLRLRLEKVGDEELREKLIEDLSQTQAMVREGLDLARSIDTSEAPQLLDLDSLLDSVCTDALEAGQSVTLEGDTHVRVLAQPVALRRCLINLIDNAVKYGHRAEVRAGKEEIGGGNVARIRIRDFGPGIPEAELQKVFEPFYRLESSRSRETGGTGLGLTIARNIAQQHGGGIELRNLGDGLEAVLILPIKAGV